jgi:hypothetical protein
MFTSVPNATIFSWESYKVAAALSTGVVRLFRRNAANDTVFGIVQQLCDKS